MKKILALILTIIMLLSSVSLLFSCISFGEQNGAEDGENENTENEGGGNGETNEKEDTESEDTENGGEDLIGGELTREKLEYALGVALDKIDYALPTFTDRFPSHSSTNNVYSAVKNNSGWNTRRI